MLLRPMRRGAADRTDFLVKTGDIKALGRRAYPDVQSPVRRILEALPAEMRVEELTGAIRAILALA